MTIIIELTNRTRKVLERYSFEQERITIGRAYDNDLIISDSYVDPYHAEITVDDSGTIIIQDLQSTNGTYLGKHQLNAKETPMDSGTELLIGKTHLRALKPSHTVPPTLIMTRMERLFNNLSRLRYTLPLLVLCFLLTLFTNYQAQFSKPELLDLSLEGITTLLLIIGWAGVCAAIGRISRHEAKFQHQLIATISFFLAYLLIEWGGELLAFNVTEPLISGAYNVILYGLTLALLFSLNFRFAFHHPSKKRLLLAHGLAWSIMGFAVLSHYSSVPDFNRQPDYTTKLLPGYLQFSDPVSKNRFFERAERVFEIEE